MPMRGRRRSEPVHSNGARPKASFVGRDAGEGKPKRKRMAPLNRPNKGTDRLFAGAAAYYRKGAGK